MGQDPEAGGGPPLKGTGPVVFHHIPKCAGTTLLELLGSGFMGRVEALPARVRWPGLPPPPAVPRHNVTDPYGQMPHRRRIGPAGIAAFEAAAALDYAVYHHRRRRWEAGGRSAAAPSNAP